MPDAPGALEHRRIDERDLTVRVDDLESLVAGLSAQLNGQRQETPALQSTALPAFVTWIAQRYRRHVEGAGFSWCVQ